MFNPDEKFTATVTIKSPMGPIKAFVNIDPADNNHFTGTAKLMGKETDITGGDVDIDGRFAERQGQCDVANKAVSVALTIDENGAIAGEASMPRRRPMSITGSVDA